MEKTMVLRMPKNTISSAILKQSKLVFKDVGFSTCVFLEPFKDDSNRFAIPSIFLDKPITPCINIYEYENEKEVGVVCGFNGGRFYKADVKFNEDENMHACFYIPEEAVEIIVYKNDDNFCIVANRISIEKRVNILNMRFQELLYLEVKEDFLDMNLYVKNIISGDNRNGSNCNSEDLFSSLKRIICLEEVIQVAIKKYGHKNSSSVNYFN